VQQCAQPARPTAYNDALPSVTVDVMNVWDEKLPGVRQCGDRGQVQRRRRQRDERGRDGGVESHPGTGGAVQAGRPDRPRCSDVELCLSLQVEAADRPGVATQHALPYDGERFGPLLETPRAMVIYTRGQEYKEDLPTPPSRFDHQSGYAEFWLHFIGVPDVRALAVENTWGDKAEASMRAAREKVTALAKEF
jgi:hypothetical protein